MRITPVYNTNYNNQYNRKPKQPTFTEHPDFIRYAYDYELTASNYFRRGNTYGPPAKEYIDVVKTFKSIFKDDTKTPKKMLIIGIGDSQEPFSYLATIKSIIKDKPLNKNLDLYTIDLQPKPGDKKLFRDSFCDSVSYPMYARSSFVYDSKHHGLSEYYRYRVNDEIFDMVKNTYNNPEKSKWDCLAQNVIKDYPDEQFDVVSINNVFPYIESDKENFEMLEQLKRVLKPKGYLITDPHKNKYMYHKGVLDGLKEIRHGIYQKQ